MADGSVVLDGGYVDADSDDAAPATDEAEGASPTGATAEPSATKTGEER